MTLFQVCTYESMQAGQHHLKRMGVHKLTQPSGLASAMNQLPDEAITIAAASHIERELQITPWNLSSNFVAATMQVEEIPPGQLPPNAGALLVEEIIDKLTQWHRIVMVRKLSSEQAASGMKLGAAVLNKFARGQQMSFLQLQQQTREKCQDIWDKQVLSLSMPDGDDSGSNGEVGGDLDSFARDLENLLEAEEGDQGGVEKGKREGIGGLGARRRKQIVQEEEDIEDEEAEVAELRRMLRAGNKFEICLILWFQFEIVFFSKCCFADDEAEEERKKKKSVSGRKEKKSEEVEIPFDLGDGQVGKIKKRILKTYHSHQEARRDLLLQRDCDYSSKEIVIWGKGEEREGLCRRLQIQFPLYLVHNFS